MGGTSTDVSRYDQEYDYRYTLEVGDARIFSPALSIETVAAGGGSLCYFDGFKLCVGPESAGAWPGPACYGAGGPLTITDVNLLLGHLDPDEFGIPVFREAAESSLDALIGEIRQGSGRQYSQEEILNGFYNIANELMAGAIRSISIARGYDPADYVLLAFGGAGGMHACRIAGLLGMETVMVPADAGLLSAYGLANAVIERFAEKLVLKPYDEIRHEIDHWIEDLGLKALDAVRREGVTGDSQVRIRTVFMRLVGQDESLPVAWQEDADLIEEFRTEYLRLYGHWTENREIEVEAIRVVASERHRDPEPTELPEKTYTPAPSKTTRSYGGGQWRDIPVFNRSELKEGALVQGYALLLDPFSTTLIEEGWEMLIDGNRTAVIRKNTAERIREEEYIRETRLELFTNRFKFIAENMGAMLQRTSLSVNIKERLDFSCALVSPDGYLVANAPHIPVHLGSLGVCVRSLANSIRMEDGDTIVTNHPAFGGSHLPDITLVTPVFTGKGEHLGYVVNRAHHAELGGTLPASMPPDASSLEEEGVVIPPFHLVRKGKTDWDGIRRILENAPYPSRTVEDNLADLNAALAANIAGAEGLKELALRYSPETVMDYMVYLREYAASRMRQTLGNIPDGHYEATELLDDQSRLKVSVDIRKDECSIDFTGTSPVHPGNMNANHAIVNSVVIYVLRLLLDEPLPLNEGFMEPVRLVLPECLLNPDFSLPPDRCPAIVGGNVEISQRLTDTLLKAFGIIACSQGTMNNIMLGNEGYSYYETVCGGCGAGDGFTGASGVHHHMTNTRITDPEIIENRYPLRLEEFSIRKRSGGKGRYRGGNGVIRVLEFMEESSLSILSQHRVEKPYGMDGGGEGKRGNQVLLRSDGTREKLKGIDAISVFPGDKLIIRTPGGGGFGSRT
jgi:5-oxoprolinase (ATP-hydrolysing)